ncbi:hypothetical protein NDU88_001183 [Pleurodeles waltl]|uniref:Fibronectin type-III domain-containing protein n=2 Tax=Pleurodeles waltl TaxID=8319 RepID=A0AAV7Q2D2_PLEWA|nr:hypothetical protein NDU88_001183 [Pleurodeles waltl]
MLYDCRNDTMIPGVSLWSTKKIDEDVLVTQQPNTDFKIILSDSLEDKASVLDISASVKASFLGGLVKVGGAAKYLKDTKTSKQKARVTLQYSTTTKFEQLTMEKLGPHNITYPEVFDHDLATHVVTGVLYGAQAFFIFDREFSSSDSKQEVHGDLTVAVKKIPTFSIEGKGKVNINDNDKDKLEKISCTFHGDFALTNNPSTYLEAIDIYKSLPSLISSNGEKVVPVKVWLYPLKNLNSGASQLLRSISSILIEDLQSVIEELNDINMHCNDMLTKPAAVHFPKVKHKIQRFKNVCLQYRLIFQNDLARALPTIRAGEEEESVLVDILTAKERSPFNTQQLSEFMEETQDEINNLSYCLNLLLESKQVQVVFSENQLNQVLLDPKFESVVSFNLPLMQEEELYLKELKYWLESHYKEQTSSPTSISLKCMEKSWLTGLDINKTRTYVKEFTDFVQNNTLNKKICFIVSSVSAPSNQKAAVPGPSIYLYEQGVLKSTAFHPPRLDAPKVDRLSEDCVLVTCAECPSGVDAILKNRVEYRQMGEESWTLMESKDRNNTINVTALQPNTSYEFRQSAVTARWVTLPSDPTNIISMNATWNLISLIEQLHSSFLKVPKKISKYNIEFLQEPKEKTECQSATATFDQESPNLCKFRLCKRTNTYADYDFLTTKGFYWPQQMCTDLSHFVNILEREECTISTDVEIAFLMDNDMYWTSNDSMITCRYKRDPACSFRVVMNTSGKVEIKDYKDRYLALKPGDFRDNISIVPQKNPPFTEFEVNYERGRVLFKASNGLFFTRYNYTGDENDQHLQACKKESDIYCQFVVVVV